MVEIIAQLSHQSASHSFNDRHSPKSLLLPHGMVCRYVDGQTEAILVPSSDNEVAHRDSVKDRSEDLLRRSQELLLTSPNLASATAPVSMDQAFSALRWDGSQLLHEAKRLRTHCFTSSFGAVFEGDLDSDEYDEACLHIILQDKGKVIATARVLDSQRAALLGRFYSENEFYLSPLLKHYPYQILEVGRTCIHPEYRNGKVLRQLWQAITHIAKYLKVNAFMGCCSIPIGAGDVDGWLRQLDRAPKLTIKPKYRLPATLLSTDIAIPPLLSTYLKMGASVSEQACFDLDFHCADVLVWLPFEQVNPRYQHLL
ncbi:GNAT family N-acetyltransferase [Psychrobacter pygoscelis]|uniref:GNAT family N-acetyltransferase n=1 Tax=Psychrobacter pygoscelis TaxID=2488563 RepID=UPI00103A2E24|nr:GNAT family N-acyltransferase [Psychrobacter pygoscelis]